MFLPLSFGFRKKSTCKVADGVGNELGTTELGWYTCRSTIIVRY